MTDANIHWMFVLTHVVEIKVQKEEIEEVNWCLQIPISIVRKEVRKFYYGEYDILDKLSFNETLKVYIILSYLIAQSQV